MIHVGVISVAVVGRGLLTSLLRSGLECGVLIVVVSICRPCASVVFDGRSSSFSYSQFSVDCVLIITDQSLCLDIGVTTYHNV